MCVVLCMMWYGPLSFSAECVCAREETRYQCAEWYAQKAILKHTSKRRHNENNHIRQWYRCVSSPNVSMREWDVAATTTQQHRWRRWNQQRRYIYITKWLYLLIHISPECVFLWKFVRFFLFLQWFSPFSSSSSPLYSVFVSVSILHARARSLLHSSKSNRECKRGRFSDLSAFIWRIVTIIHTSNILFKTPNWLVFTLASPHINFCLIRSISLSLSFFSLSIIWWYGCMVVLFQRLGSHSVSFFLFFIPISHKLILNASSSGHAAGS